MLFRDIIILISIYKQSLDLNYKFHWFSTILFNDLLLSICSPVDVLSSLAETTWPVPGLPSEILQHFVLLLQCCLCWTWPQCS